MESWSYGFKPNWIAELRTWFSWSNPPSLGELLRAIARREFGAGSESDVLQGWEQFDRAISLVPGTGGTMGNTCSVAQPLFFEKPQPRTRTIDHSWQDTALWMQRSGINPYWPYVFSPWYVFWPDFTNKVNQAERYVQPFTLATFTKTLLRAADAMEQGLRPYRRAALSAPERKRYGAFREVLLAEQIQRMMRAEDAVLEFEDLRFRLSNAEDRSARARMLDRMEAILREEIPRTEASRETALRDSRLGYEWEQDYFYSPFTLGEKLKLLHLALEEQIPAYRKRNNLP
jgi:hypothetical protein